MILEDIYVFLKSRGLAPTHAAFSTDYLGHSARYYDYLRCSHAKPSLCSLLKVANRLRGIERTDKVGDAGQRAGELAMQAMAEALTRCR